MAWQVGPRFARDLKVHRPVLTNLICPDPFVHHNSLSTAGKSRAYNPSTHSLLPPGQGNVYHAGQTVREAVNQGSSMHGMTLYPDSIAAGDSHPDCENCHSRREERRPHVCPCCRTPFEERPNERDCSHEYRMSDVPYRRNRSSSRSGEYDVYHRYPQTRHSSRRRDSISTRAEHMNHTPSPERPPRSQRDNADEYRGRRREQAERLDEIESGMANIRVGVSPLGSSDRQRTHERINRSQSQDGGNGPVNFAADPLNEQVFPLVHHQSSPSRQHRQTYKGHKTAAMDSYSKLRRDPAKPRGYGRD
jgi:hypothetical protein